MVFENITDEAIKENRMKHGCYQTKNNTLCYYQTDFNISVILGQPSDGNDMLKEQVDNRKNVRSM